MLLNFALNNFTPSGGVSEVYFSGGWLTVVNNCTQSQGSSAPYTAPFEVVIENTLEISANPGGLMLGIYSETQTVNHGSSVQFEIVTIDENAIPTPESITLNLAYDTFRIPGYEDSGGGTWTNPYGDLILKVSDSDSSTLLESIPLITDGSLANVGLNWNPTKQIPITKWATNTKFDLEATIKYVVGEA